MPRLSPCIILLLVLKAVNKFCRNLLQEVEFENAVAGRIDIEVLAGIAVAPKPFNNTFDAGGVAGGVSAGNLPI